MKNKLILTHVFLFIFCCSTAISAFAFKPIEPEPLKVLSYNLRFGELASLKELADFIKDQNPDVVALQEVDSRTFREDAEHQNDKDFATELGFYTKMFPAY